LFILGNSGVIILEFGITAVGLKFFCATFFDICFSSDSLFLFIFSYEFFLKAFIL